MSRLKVYNAATATWEYTGGGGGGGTAVIDVGALPAASFGNETDELIIDQSGVPRRITKRLLAPIITQRGLVNPFSLYHPGDVVVMNDGITVMIKLDVQADVNGFIGAANYIRLGNLDSRNAQVYGLLSGGNIADAAVNFAAIQNAVTACNPTNANGAGGVCKIPPGTYYINATLNIPSGVTLEGAGPFGTYLKLAPQSNCTMIKPHTSTNGTTDANAMFWSVKGMTLDCREIDQGVILTADVTLTAGSAVIISQTRAWVNSERVVGSGILPDTTIVPGSQTGTGPWSANMSTVAQQSLTSATVHCGVTVPMYGIHYQTNPINTTATADFMFDPTGWIENVHVRNNRDGGFASFGRGAIRHMGTKVSNCLGISYISSFDGHYIGCESDYASWHGFDLRGSSNQLVGCKSFNSGQTKTTAAATFNLGHGYSINGSYYEEAFGGCDAQQCSGDSWHFTGAKTISIGGCNSAQPGFGGASGSGVGLSLDNCSGVVANMTNGSQTGMSAVAFIGGSDLNTINISHIAYPSQTPAAALTAGSTLLSNALTVNGTAINAPGLVTASSQSTALPSQMGRTNTLGSPQGSWYTPYGVTTGANATPTATQGFAYPIVLPRAGMTIQGVCVRVQTAGVASVCRIGFYLSNLTGADAFSFLSEATSATQIDTTVTGPRSMDVAVPQLISGTIVWVCVASQGTTMPLLYTYQGGVLAGSTANCIPTTAWQTANITGAMPSTIFTANAGPIGAGSVTAVQIRCTG